MVFSRLKGCENVHDRRLRNSRNTLKIDILKNVLAVVLGTFIMMSLNIAILTIGMKCGVPDLSMEDLHALAGSELLYFLSPFLAHSIPSLVGPYIGVKIASSNKFLIAMIIMSFHLMGGIYMAFFFAEIDAPTWYDLADVTLAYVPMGYLGWKLAK